MKLRYLLDGLPAYIRDAAAELVKMPNDWAADGDQTITLEEWQRRDAAMADSE